MFLKFHSFLSSARMFADRLTEIFSSPRATVAFWWAMLQAETKFTQTGVRQYIIPSTKHRVLRITDFNAEMHSQGLNMTKNKGYHDKDLTKPQALMDQAFYWTRSHKCRYRWRRSMSPTVKRFRRSMFYSWWNSKHNTK